MLQHQKEYTNSIYEESNIMKLIESNHISIRNLRKAEKINLLRNNKQIQEMQLKQLNDKTETIKLLNTILNQTDYNIIITQIGALIDFISCHLVPSTAAKEFEIVFKFLRKEYPLNLRAKVLEIINALTSKSYEEYCSVINVSTVPLLLEVLFTEENESIMETLFCIIGNAARDDKEFRLLMIKSDAGNAMLKISQRELKRNSFNTLLYATSGLCYQPEGDLSSYIPLIAIANEALNYTDENILLLSTVTFFYIGEHFCNFSVLIKTIDMPKCIQVLSQCKHMETIKYMVTFFGNIILGDSDPDMSLFLVENGIMEIVDSIFQYGTNVVKQQCCWILSNICTTLPVHIKHVMKEGIWSSVLSFTSDDCTPLKIEAFNILRAIMEKGNSIQQDIIVKDEQTLHNIIEAVKLENNLLSILCLHLLGLIVRYAPNYITYTISRNGYLDVLYKTIFSKNPAICNEAEQIVELIDHYK